MSKIISLIINFLNRINKFTLKIIIFMAKFIKVEDIIIDNKPTDEKYRQFKVNEPSITEPFVQLEHKDYKQLIKDNNIKPIIRRNSKDITIDIKCPCCGAPKNISMTIMVNKLSLNVRFALIFLLIILLKR